MIIERADGITDICEMKYSRYEYTSFQAEYPHHKAIRTVLVTTKGLTQGEHSGDFNKVLTLKDLFVENTEEF